MTTLPLSHHIARRLGQRSVAPDRRAAMVALTLACAGLALAHGAVAQQPVVADDLARLLRFMAALKLAFAAVVVGGSLWRLARPAVGWRAATYVAGPGLVVFGGIAMWFLHAAIGAPILHLGLFAWLGAALTDPHFLPDRPTARSRTKRDG